MSAHRELNTLEFWAANYWRMASKSDGLRGDLGQYAEWRAVKYWLWGFIASAKTKEAREAAEFLSEMASERGCLP